LQLACVPDTRQSRQAYWWLLNFFTLVGDFAPNRDQLVQLPGIYTKESIHTIFKHHIKKTYTGDEDNEPLSLSGFKDLWYRVFSKVRITRFCQVCGKCATCHWIYERQEIFKSEEDLSNIKYLASVHKILIEMERGVYINKRQLAQDHPELYMSLIIDGMSNVSSLFNL
jgi:hypothetical protein